jgi:hypothetical protein
MLVSKVAMLFATSVAIVAKLLILLAAIAPFATKGVTLLINLAAFLAPASVFLTKALIFLTSASIFFIKASTFLIKIVRLLRNSAIIEKAQRHLENLKSVDPHMAFDSDRSIQNLASRIEALGMKLTAYNQMLMMLDSMKIDLDGMEKELSELLEQMMIAVAFKYGKDSQEFEKAGGTRKSDQINRSRAARIRNNAQRTNPDSDQQSATKAN